MTFAFKTFLRTGSLNSLHVGMPKVQVVEILGLPELAGGTSRKYHHAQIFKYNSLEIHFDQDKPNFCSRIYVERPIDGNVIQLPTCLEIEMWDLPAIARKVDVEEYLEIHEIPLESIVMSEGSPSFLRIISSGITIQFDEENRLWAISTS